MQDKLSPSPPANRLPRLLWILSFLCLGLVIPYLAEQVQYHIVRGRLRARSEFAAEELARLDKTAELVRLSDTSRAFRMVAQRVEPSVVHIDTEQIATAQDEWAYLPGYLRPRLQDQGSGVVVDADKGYVLTNYHVVQNAGVIQVRLSDGQTIDGGDVRVVGYDVLTDLALLKVNAGGLIAAPWGDSRELEVGDWVLAVGNPYGLDRTVTSGIVSAKQRRGVSQNAFQDFLQTDAAVNPGSSGGPLLNIRGEVVGITTAIVGHAYQGISFAIPSEVAQKVYLQLKENRTVARGWLGVSMQNLTPDLAQHFQLPDTEGVLVAGVLQNSPAAQAGLLPGDVIITWNGQKVPAVEELRWLVAGTAVGSKTAVEVIRNGQKKNLEVTVGERPPEDELRRLR